MKTKRCCMCKDDLPVSKFKKNGRRPDGLQSQCIECQRAYRRQHYEDNKEKYKRKANKRKAKDREELTKWFREYKASLNCERCPENHPACLTFHHRDDNKEADVSRMVSNCRSKEAILKEIAKCECLCANCHLKEHNAEVFAGLM